jgi:hypothetical protein
MPNKTVCQKGWVYSVDATLQYIRSFTNVLYICSSVTQEDKYVEHCPARHLSGLAGADFKFQWIGMVEYIPGLSALAVHWGFLPATELARRKILIERNIKKRTGPALWA